MKIKSEYVLTLFLIALAIAFRTVFHLGPNVELVTIASVAAGYFLKNKRLALLVPLCIMMISDALIGNSSIFLFTWSAFLVAPLLGMVAQSAKFRELFPNFPSTLKVVLFGTGGSLLSVLLFFLWTNFGVVITTTMYPDTFAGLVNSYINALPFLKNQLAGNLVFAPVIFLTIQYFHDLMENRQPVGVVHKNFKV